MGTDDQFAAIATLIGEPARATMLWNLLDGRAHTAGELALVSDISPQAASNHLHKLIAADLLKVEKQGKHRYYRFAKTEVAYAIEAIANLIPLKKAFQRQPPCANGDIRFCRSCYDHLAGKVAVDITRALVREKILLLEADQFIITDAGKEWFAQLGIRVDEWNKSKRALAKPCLDWTERKYHLAGALGMALYSRMQQLNWVRPTANSRIIILTGEGQHELNNRRLL